MEWLIGLVCVGLLILGILGYGVMIYNGLVRARNAYRSAFAQIDVQLTRRHDLIPNLVEVAKGYMRHERDTLDAVATARAAAVTAQAAVAAQDGGGAGATGESGAIGHLAGAENMLTLALSRMFALAEGYPELKANQTMLALQEELTTTENRVAFARQAYNDAVMIYNTKRETFPANRVAGVLSFRPATLFETSDPRERETPQISF